MARGNFIAYLEHGLNSHDLAAIDVIIEEAGEKVTDFQGEKLNYLKVFKTEVLISNGKVHNEILKIVEESK